MAGQCFSIFFSTVLAAKQKMPELQRKRPKARCTLAFSSDGFFKA
jgi:hypothetical protein